MIRQTIGHRVIWSEGLPPENNWYLAVVGRMIFVLWFNKAARPNWWIGRPGKCEAVLDSEVRCWAYLPPTPTFECVDSSSVET